MRTPSLAKALAARKKAPLRASALEAQAEAREAAEASAALARVQASRPLKPPPGRPEIRRATVGERELASERRAGRVDTRDLHFDVGPEEDE